MTSRQDGICRTVAAIAGLTIELRRGGHPSRRYRRSAQPSTVPVPDEMIDPHPKWLWDPTIGAPGIVDATGQPGWIFDTHHQHLRQPSPANTTRGWFAFRHTSQASEASRSR